MKPFLHTLFALLTLALLHKHGLPPHPTYTPAPTAYRVSTRLPLGGVSTTRETPAPTHANRTRNTGHPAGHGTRDPWRRPKNGTKTKTRNNPRIEQTPNSECCLMHQRAHRLLAISQPKPFLLPQSPKTKISNATEPRTAPECRSMDIVPEPAKNKVGLELKMHPGKTRG
eukprot:4341889-Pyramimonas_sp.AAC.1